MLAAEKHKSTPFAPIGIGLTLFACHLWGVVYTGAAMNTARAFGPAVVSGFDIQYWVGPLIGSLMATLLYSFLKHIKYWKLNPDQDVHDPKMSPPDPLQNVISSSRKTEETDTASARAKPRNANGTNSHVANVVEGDYNPRGQHV
ncbi:Aquaporin AltName: Full=BfWC1 [Rhizoctonia solani AG-1 IB]|uniref:Rhizoctonia solani AG1-IB WGS project CAOJ00000000 data, isolate 7/3/14, contig 19940 n=1 Tax=Thanatephorus cucumeris (strain AG1-IB / isolate 7/3/14) TaxID=1108050 RepID=M5C6H5_THACB|nr:Aquaporin AltName: Full=BfWC1 [Rhizoctonia solani AG-1 IB]